MRLYSLYRKDGRRYVRVAGAGAYAKPTAVRVFQDRLIGSAFTSDPLCLRPVPDVKATETPRSYMLCNACSVHVHNDCAGGDCGCGCRMIGGR